MYGKMQEVGFTEIIPLICTSAICDQYPMFSYPEVPQGSAVGSGCSLMPARWQVFLLRWVLSGSVALHRLWLQPLMTMISFVYWHGRKYSISHYLLYLSPPSLFHNPSWQEDFISSLRPYASWNSHRWTFIFVYLYWRSSDTLIQTPPCFALDVLNLRKLSLPQ